MAITEVMHDPEFVPTPETPEDRVLGRGGPCLFCGEWIEPESSEAFEIRVLSPVRGAQYVSHEQCLEQALHPSVPRPS